MASMSLHSVQWSTLRALPAPVRLLNLPRPRYTCYATGAATAGRSQLKSELKGLSTQPYRVDSDQKAKIEDLVKQLEADSPTPCPKNCLDKLAGTWLVLYAAREAHSVFGGLTLHQVCVTLDVDEKVLTKSLEFTEDEKHALAGAFNVSVNYDWATDCKMKFDMDTCKGEFTPKADELKAKLGDHTDDVMQAHIQGVTEIDITYEDDGMLLGRDENGNVSVLEHRVTRIHA